MQTPIFLPYLLLTPEPMAIRHQESLSRRILALQSGLAILAIVIGASERVEAVRWALYLGKLALPIVLASWGLFLVTVILFLVAVYRRICRPRSGALVPEGRYALERRFAMVVASLVLAAVAYCGILPLVM